jgi:osmotically-inducible protein OsmY
MAAAPKPGDGPSVARPPGVGAVTGSVSQAPDQTTPLAPGSAGRRGIRSEALRRLRRSGYSPLEGVACDARGGSVRLLGRLPSYYLKQMAQAIVAEVEGVRLVVNRIEVAARACPPCPGPGRASRAGEPIDIGHDYSS